MTRLSDIVSFNLGIPKRTFRLLTHYLRFYQRWGSARLVFVRETDETLEYWLRNATCYYTVGMKVRENTVELRKVYFSFDLRRDVSVQQVIGPADRRASYLEMLEVMIRSERQRKLRQLQSVSQNGKVLDSMLTKKKLLPSAVAKTDVSVSEATAPIAVDSDERHFPMFLSDVVCGLLASNPSYEQEKLLDEAYWFADKMVEILKQRREVLRFENEED
jgi:hypothetical protein